MAMPPFFIDVTMKLSQCSPLIVAVLTTAAVSTAWSQPQGQQFGPNKQALHDQILSLKKRLASTGLPEGSWAVDARTQIGTLLNVKGVARVTDTRCFGGGCYATVGYASLEQAPSTQRLVIDKLNAWKLGIFVSGIEFDSEGHASGLVALAGKNL
jgi:hypothetical protein